MRGASLAQIFRGEPGRVFAHPMRSQLRTRHNESSTSRPAIATQKQPSLFGDRRAVRAQVGAGQGGVILRELSEIGVLTHRNRAGSFGVWFGVPDRPPVAGCDRGE